MSEVNLIARPLRAQVVRPGGNVTVHGTGPQAVNVVRTGVMVTGGGGAGGGPARRLLTADTAFHIDNAAGDDVTGDGSMLAPWASLNHAFRSLANDYDLQGHVATLALAASATVYDGLVQVGTLAPNGVIYIVGQGADETGVIIGNVPEYGAAIQLDTINGCRIFINNLTFEGPARENHVELSNISNGCVVIFGTDPEENPGVIGITRDWTWIAGGYYGGQVAFWYDLNVTGPATWQRFARGYSGGSSQISLDNLKVTGGPLTIAVAPIIFEDGFVEWYVGSITGTVTAPVKGYGTSSGNVREYSDVPGTGDYVLTSGAWVQHPDDTFTGAVFDSTTPGLVPASGTPSGKYLRDDGSWNFPGSGLNVVAAAPSANQNDYSASGYVAGAAIAQLLRLAVTASIKLTGVAAGASGALLTIHNAATDYLLWLEHESSSSSAANRFTLPGTLPAFLMPGDAITFYYDGTGARWIVKDWPNRGTAMGLTEFSDFGGQAASSSGQAMEPWTGIFSGTGAGFSNSGTYGVDATEKVMGQAQLSTGTTATGRASVGQSGASQIIKTAGPRIAVARVAVQTAVTGTETYTVRVGFSDESTGTLTDAICWEYRWNGSAAEWSQTVVAAATATRSASGSPAPDLTYIWCAVFVNAAGTRADFIWSQDSASFTLAGSVTSGVPANPTAFQAVGIFKSAGTTARLCNVDLAGYRCDAQRG